MHDVPSDDEVSLELWPARRRDAMAIIKSVFTLAGGLAFQNCRSMLEAAPKKPGAHTPPGFGDA
jgi:hypothetical protein